MPLPPKNERRNGRSNYEPRFRFVKVAAVQLDLDNIFTLKEEKKKKKITLKAFLGGDHVFSLIAANAAPRTNKP